MKKTTILIIICAAILTACGSAGSENGMPDPVSVTDVSSLPESCMIDNSEEQNLEQTVSEGSAEESVEESVEEPSDESSIPEESSAEVTAIPKLTAEDVHFEEGSRVRFTSDKYPGKQLYFRIREYDERIYPYPFYVVDKELFSVEWDDGVATVFEGRYVTTPVPYFGKEIEPSECKANVIVCREGSLFWSANDGVLYPIGKLIIHYNDTAHLGSVTFAVDSRGQREKLYNPSFEDLFTLDGSDYIFVYSLSFEISNFPSWIVFNSKTGKPCSLPVPDEYRWSVEEIAFDTESEDPDAVIVKYRENGELKTLKASLKDTRTVELYDYYCEDPDAEWDGD